MSVSAAEPPVRQRGDRLRLRLGPMVHGGACLAHDDAGHTLLVDGGIPDEVVEAELLYRKKRTWFARVATVAEPSPFRVVPPCPYVPACGGCQLQHVTYAHQLTLKQGIVEDAMRRQGVELPAPPQVHGMDDPWRYRWRGEFHAVRDAANRVTGLGFNRLRSWTPIAVNDCLIHHPTITAALPGLVSIAGTEAADTLSLVHLTAGDDGSELVVLPKPAGTLSDAALGRLAEALPAPIRLSTAGTTIHWRGRLFRASADSFIQVNQAQMDVLYACVLSALEDVVDGGRIVDAYAGIGLLGVALAERAREVVCIESNRTAATFGVLNAQLNSVEDRVWYVAEAVEAALSGVVEHEPVDALVLDPPRAGCDSRVTAWLALAGPPRVVYISCDPATLARDLHLLVTSGPYLLETLELVDMFPQTHHVECVASLTRAN
ncbi:MAG: class I SAM-dependent RNA methyltransferase [Candidatus Dormibacteria bacterium]